MTKSSPPIPPTGGSFVVDAKGKLVQQERTRGPLEVPAGTVPAHAANVPASPPGANKER